VADDRVGSPSVCGGSLVVEGEEAGEDFLVGEVGRPAVGGEDGFVEGAVGVGEPLHFSFSASVVELGEGAVFEVGFGGVGRVEPVVAEADEFAGCVGDGADDGGVGLRGFGAGWVGEGEGVEGGCSIVGWSTALISISMP